MTAGRMRMRPILMTALTTILAMSTMALGIGDGSDMVQPMAIVTIGGMIYGTILTVIVVPVIYDVLSPGEAVSVMLFCFLLTNRSICYNMCITNGNPV